MKKMILPVVSDLARTADRFGEMKRLPWSHNRTDGRRLRAVGRIKRDALHGSL